MKNFAKISAILAILSSQAIAQAPQGQAPQGQGQQGQGQPPRGQAL